MALVLCLVAPSALAEPVPAKLEAALAAKSSRVRIAAIAAVGRSDGDNAGVLLRRMLGDKIATVRAAAVEALGNVGELEQSAIALKRMSKDKSPLVRKINVQALKKLALREKLRGNEAVNVHLFAVRNSTGQEIPEALALLKNTVVSSLKKDIRHRFGIQPDSSQKGFGLMLKIKGIKPFAQDDVTGEQVDCEVTVVELPSKNLRMNSVASTGAGISGTLSDAMKKELTGDAILACAPALVDDFADFVTKMNAL